MLNISPISRADHRKRFGEMHPYKILFLWKIDYYGIYVTHKWHFSVKSSQLNDLCIPWERIGRFHVATKHILIVNKTVQSVHKSMNTG